MEENKQIVEIDYDKLADAIVKANHKVEEEKQRQNTLDKGLTKLTMALFIIMGVICFLFAGCGVVAIVKVFQTMNWKDIASVIAYFIAIAIFIVLFAYISLLGFTFIKSAKDVSKEKDRNYIIAIFSTIIGFVSLIVAIIAFMKSTM